MQQYINMFGTIMLLYVSILNLSSIKFKFKEIIVVLCLTQVIAGVTLAITGEFAAMVAILATAIVFLHIKSKKIIISISLPIVSVLICVILDSLISIVFIYIFKLDSQIINKKISIYWQFFVIEFILVFMISKILGLLVNKKSNISFLEIDGLFGVLLMISLMLTLIIFYTNIFMEPNSGYTKEGIRTNGILILIFSLLLVVIIYTLFNSMKRDIEAKSKEIQLIQMKEYTNSLEKLYNDMRAFRHDYINILGSIVGYIEDDDMTGLKDHFNQNIIPLSKSMESNNFKIGLLKNLMIPELKGIVSSKLIRAQELGIDIFIEIIEEIDKISINIIDLCRVIGILLDNAIEAAEECDKPFVKLAIVKKQNAVVIVLINSCREGIPPIHKLYQRGFSTRGENRGLGLNNVREILNKYSNAILDTSVSSMEFNQYLEITNR